MAAVLFDCDGVLVNTEALVTRAGREVLSGYGLIYSEQEYEDNFLGASMDRFRDKVRADWLDRTGVSVPEQIFSDIQTRYMQMEAGHIQAIAGVRDLIESLVRSHVPFAIASNGNRVNIERKLKAVGLFDFFDGKIVSREDVAQGKPAPDVYLMAMTLVGETDPQKCIVVEDSPVGATAGHAAGMHVMGYAGGSANSAAYAPKLVQAGAHFTGNSMGAIAMEVFSVIDEIRQGPNHRNAPALARLRAKNGPQGPATP